MIGRGSRRTYSLRPFGALASLPLCLFLLAGILALGSCSANRKALLLTDSPEILLAVELFNSTHADALIEVDYAENIVETLAEYQGDTARIPSLVVGRGLSGSALSGRFTRLDQLIGRFGLHSEAFYPSLLAAGRRGSDQVLLPVSFNTLLILASRGGSSGGEDYLPPGTIASMEELRSASMRFSPLQGSGGSMGFSPRWPDRDLLFQWAQLSGVGFREGQEGRVLEWNAEALDGFASSLSGSTEAEDAFAFKYLRAPGYKNVESGRILFTALASRDFFLLPPLERARFAFRHFGEGGRIPVLESALYAGIPKGSRGRKTAQNFLLWFFRRETQEALLSRSRDLRILESSFGVAGGFSSLIEVTESVMPRFYGDLAGMLPQSGALLPAPVLHSAWKRIKEELVIPWLSDPKSGSEQFSQALSAYLDRNPELRK